MLNKIDLFGFSFISESNIDVVVNDVLNAESYTENGTYPFLITPNVDILVQLAKKEYADLRRSITNSMYILPDGQPIILSSKLLGKTLKTRLAGSDLFPVLWNKSKAYKFKILALTTSAKVSELLEKDHENVVCYTLPIFSSNDKEKIDHISLVCASMAKENNFKLILIGISFPKQNILAVNIHNMLAKEGYKEMPLIATLGASFEFYLKIKKRAPVFLQKIGFEWLYRFSKEPIRLFKRYFIEDIKFISIFFKELVLRKKS